MAEGEGPPTSHGPRTGSDPSNAAQETAVLRAEVRGLEGVLLERAAALNKALRAADENYQREWRERWDGHRKEHALIEMAVSKAEASVDKRLEAMNELRAQINNERAVYLTRAVYETNHQQLRERVQANGDKILLLDAALSSLREDLSALRSGQEWLVRVVVGSVLTAIITGVVAVLLSTLRT